MFSKKSLLISFVAISLIVLWAEYQANRQPEGLASVLPSENGWAFSVDFDSACKTGLLGKRTVYFQAAAHGTVHHVHAKVDSIRRSSGVSFSKHPVSAFISGWDASVKFGRGGVSVFAPEGTAYTITVYDGVGNALRSKAVIKGGNVTMPIEGLPHGIYFVMVASQQKKIVARITLSSQ